MSDPPPEWRDEDQPPPTAGKHGSDEEIDEASDESFPASDAPQWWSGEPKNGD